MSCEEKCGKESDESDEDVLYTLYKYSCLLPFWSKCISGKHNCSCRIDSASDKSTAHKFTHTYSLYYHRLEDHHQDSENDRDRNSYTEVILLCTSSCTSSNSCAGSAYRSCRSYCDNQRLIVNFQDLGSKPPHEKNDYWSYNPCDAKTIETKFGDIAEEDAKSHNDKSCLDVELCAYCRAHICSLEPAVKLEIALTVAKGRGFVAADENRDPEAVIGTIPVDAIYTPIKNVYWTVENWRVEQKTDYEKLNLEIVTDGSITPNVALQEAANILIYHFKLFTDDKKLSLESSIEAESKELDEESLHMRHLLLTKLSDMGLSVRAYNCLKAADIDTFADLVSYSRAELMKFRNFGRKSLNEIYLLVEKMKLSFGMDVTKYNIEPKKKNV